MLDWIIRQSLRHRLLVLVLSAGIVIAGVVALARLPVDAFPDTTPVQVVINAPATALSPLEVERQVTFPIEQAISGLPGLLEVRSLSRFGLSQVTATFEEGADLHRSRQAVAERLAAVTLPPGIDRPTLGPIATGLGEVFHYLVSLRDPGKGTSGDIEPAPATDPSPLRMEQDWIIRPQLRSVRGVAEINSWGGDERRIEVRVDPRDLYKHGLTLRALVEALERNNENAGGGTVDLAGESSLVHGVGYVVKPKEIEEIVVAARNGVPILVKDLATVAEGRAIRHGAVTADGKGEVVLGLGFMLAGENSRDVTRRLRLRLEEAAKSLPAGVRAEIVYDRAVLVDKVLRTVATNLFEGAILVVAVLFVFLGNLRAGLIVASAIPLSMLLAFDQMVRVGVAGSLMSLGAIDFGLVVDSSVIMVENSIAQLASDPGPRSRTAIVEAAALEVRRPTMFGELIIMIVYLPILFLEGTEGKLFRPMALTAIFALAASMVLSMTLVPVLASLFLQRHPRHADHAMTRAMTAGYRRLLALAFRRRRLLVAGTLLAVAAAGLLATRIGSEFVPHLQEGTIVINTIRLAGVSLDESVRYGTHIEKALLAAFPDEIERIWTRTGSAEVATDPMGVEVSDIFVMLRPRREWKRVRSQDELVAGMEAVLTPFPGMRAVFSQPIEMRFNEMVAGIRADVGVKIFGADFEILKEEARRIEALLRALPGAADVVTEQITGQPVLEIAVDREAIARHGIAAADVLDAVRALGGIEAGEMQEGERRFPIVVRLGEDLRHDADAIGRILVSSPSGAYVPLSRLARIEAGSAPSAINREWAQRRIVVQANVRGRDVGSFVADARRSIAREISLPAGYFIRFGGQFEHLARARTRLMIVVPIALALILLLVYATFRSVRDTIAVFTAVPVAAIGGILALWARGIPFSISAGVGFVALSGVSVLGQLVLVSTIRQNLAAGQALHEAVVRAAERRLRPVLMTSLVASLGFVPMAFSQGLGAEVQRPLATVVIGGVVSSTFLTLLLFPVLYAAVARRGEPDEPGPRGA